MSQIVHSLNLIHQKIRCYAQQYGRNVGDIKLLAVSKMQTARRIQEAFTAQQCCFGENYLQEALIKIKQLEHLPLEWHFIGRIQSNKTKAIAEYFDWVHGVCNYKIAERLAKQRPKHKAALNILIQVNLSEEASKEGLIDFDDILKLAQNIKNLPQIMFRGLMAIPEIEENFEKQRETFAKLRKIQEKLENFNIRLDTLSMGMSNDFEAAIAEGSTLLRIGTAIFGERG